MRKGLTATVMAAMLVTAVAPAEAGPRRGGWRGHGGWHHGGWHHRGGTSLGDVIVGGLIIGAIASVVSGAAKRERQAREGDYEVLNPGDDGRGDDYRGEGDRGERDRAEDSRRGGEDQAVDACAGAIESGSAQVEEISDVGRFSNGYRVEGVVVTGSGADRLLDSFSCSVREGQVADIRYGSQYRAER